MLECKKEAVEFVEWIIEELYTPSGIKGRWLNYQKTEHYTVEELYEKYITRKCYAAKTART